MSPLPNPNNEKPNPHLKPLEILIGEWDAVGSHPYFPDEILRGHTTFQWHEGGAFIIMRSEVYHEKFPAGIAIFGSDDTSNEFTMIYYDDREVSRKYMCTLKDNIWTWWRNDNEFSQRFICKISPDGNTIIGQGEMAKNNGSWEKDLALTYTRVR